MNILFMPFCVMADSAALANLPVRPWVGVHKF